MGSIFGERRLRRGFAPGLAAAAVAAVLVASHLPTRAQTPAAAPASVSGAVGFGAVATGGAGGATVHVSTLNDSGPGSLRDAVSAGHRTVVFDIAGTIELRTPLTIHGDVTVAGDTAPGSGITVEGQEVSLSSQTNVILRYLRIREGMTGGKKKAALAVHAAHKLLIDHCSIEWGRWDCVDMNESSDVTIQHCMIGQGINPQRFGCLCGSDNVTFWKNLFIDNQSRNPKAKGSVQYINNVVYDWGVTGFVGGHSAGVHTADLIGNYFIAGPKSSSHWNGEWKDTDHIYQAGNFDDMNRDGKVNGTLATAADFGGPTLVQTPFLHPAAAVPIGTAQEAYADVVREAGCSRQRDAVDLHLIQELTSAGTQGKIIEDPKELAAP